MTTRPAQQAPSYGLAPSIMSTITRTRLIGWSGLVNIVVGLLYALETLLHSARDIHALAVITQQSDLGVSWYVSHTMGIVAGLLGLVGLIGLYVLQFNRLST